MNKDLSCCLCLFIICIKIFASFQVEKIIDLTHTVSEDTIHWPTASAFNFTEKIKVCFVVRFIYKIKFSD